MAESKVIPFKVQVSDEVLKDLRERLEQTRFPGEVADSGWEYGTNLAYLKELVEYWRLRYDWLRTSRFAMRARRRMLCCRCLGVTKECDGGWVSVSLLSFEEGCAP